MDAFLEALTGGENKIPPEFDWFAPLLGDWDFEYTDGLGGGRAIEKLGGRLLEVCETPRDCFAWYEGIPRHRIYQLDL